MNKRKWKKAIKRITYLPQNRYFFPYSFNKLKHFYFRLIHSDRVARPSTIMLELTNHCNLRCTTCPREYAFGKEMDKGYVSPELAKKVIDELCPYLDSIGLTGMGETFMYNNIEEIVDYIKSRNNGIIISMSTNAVLPDFMQKVIPLINKVDTIQISIDGLDEIYESIRINAKFAKLKKNLAELADLCTNSETDLMLNMVVTRENYSHMAPLVEFANKIGIYYINYTLFNLGSVTDINTEYYRFYQSEDFINEMKKLRETQVKYKMIEITHWDFTSKNEFRKCMFPWTHFYICWNGYVVPCCAKPFPKELNFGNVFESNVMKILNGESFRSFRRLWYKNQTPDFCNKCHFVDLDPINI